MILITLSSVCKTNKNTVLLLEYTPDSDNSGATDWLWWISTAQEEDKRTLDVSMYSYVDWGNVATIRSVSLQLGCFPQWLIPDTSLSVGYGGWQIPHNESQVWLSWSKPVVECCWIARTVDLWPRPLRCCIITWVQSWNQWLILDLYPLH